MRKHLFRGRQIYSDARPEEGLKLLPSPIPHLFGQFLFRLKFEHQHILAVTHLLTQPPQHGAQAALQAIATAKPGARSISISSGSPLGYDLWVMHFFIHPTAELHAFQ
jgi:hypothetical protein